MALTYHHPAIRYSPDDDEGRLESLTCLPLALLQLACWRQRQVHTPREEMTLFLAQESSCQ